MGATEDDTQGADTFRTLADKALAQLQEDIVCGAIAPGTKLSETRLAERYGVSRGPMREVIRCLESRKLLERTAHVGTRVTSLDPAALSQLYYVREALEGMAAHLAATAMSEDEITAIQELLATHERQQDIQRDTAYFQYEGDLDFHYRIFEGSHNHALQETLTNEIYYLLRMSRYRYSGVHKRPQQALAEHRQIVEAIAERDAELAELLMRRHISRARRNIENQIGDQ
ncbi:GntR family transcriptional regulator [Salinisphaera sp. SPP-AMP-43]|uniref:GntR family transcriptional regulator n=1 Tax=Salinisphaera sp. SPP-AMP-43 TaxID=3121288 RepID=UPI003C6DCD70